MGLIDQILQSFGQQSSGARQEDQPLMEAAAALLDPDNSSGGLMGLMQSFQKKGLGDIVGSWISTGENKPISGQQLQQGLGEGIVAMVASRTGLSNADVTQKLSQLLPVLIDKLTPNGKVPEALTDKEIH
ncbi:MAG TPA: hypothetical protein DF383_10995 [Deltaproteobacteria bacterium]|nr:hypothetical protein [Deltaproteobacteria bacterium]